MMSPTIIHWNGQKELTQNEVNRAQNKEVRISMV